MTEPGRRSAPASRRPIEAARPAPACRRRATAEGPVVVVVDDDASVCHSLSAMLETCGFRVLSYRSGVVFLADAAHRRTDCLIIDHDMPELDGLAVLATLKARGISTPAILITGRLEPPAAARAERLGAAATLEKPFAAERLLGLIRSALRGRR